MNKIWMLFLLLTTINANALQISDLAEFIPGFTAHPLEENIKPNTKEGEAVLLEAANSRVKEDSTSRFIIENESRRGKITPNPKSSEILYAEHLLEDPDSTVNPACYKEPGVCEERVVEKTCEERSQYTPLVCNHPLKLHLNSKEHLEGYWYFFSNQPTINITTCGILVPPFCNKAKVVNLHPRCEHLVVQVDARGTIIPLSKTATCEDPTITINYAFPPNSYGIRLTVKTTEYWSDETQIDDNRDCDTHARDGTNGYCVSESSNMCLEPNQTKVIDGVPITKKCWGTSESYQCATGTMSTCEPLLDEGCSNTSSICKAATGTHCDVISKTFQCPEKRCLPDRIVCPEKTPCADGNCDKSEAEETDDLNEGISRLGALGGTAEDVSTHQVNNNQPGIFRGEVQTCKEYILNSRDCCTDKGWLEGLIQCPEKLKNLQKAKLESRVVELGSYHDDIWGKLYVYCVFPTKLAGIVQIEGRGNQLKIPFGTAKSPDCSGITPQQMEHIDFGLLDLNPIVDEVKAKKVFPDGSTIDTTNAAHVEALHDQGVPHD